MLALDKMDSAEIGRYLASQGVLPIDAQLTVEALGGGVSNIVLKGHNAGAVLGAQAGAA